MNEQNSYRDWFVLTKSKDGLNLNEVNLQFLISLILVGCTSIIRIIKIEELEYRTYSQYNPNEPLPDITTSIIDGFVVILFHLVLLLILQIAYEEEGFAKAMRQVSYAAQLWMLADVCLILESFVKGLIFDPDYNTLYTSISNYYLLWAIATIMSLFYLMGPIIERLNSSFEEYGKVIMASLVASGVIYWVSYGLTQIIRLLILLPFGGV